MVEEYSEPSDVVEFEVRDGVAIAFGDVILGTPDADSIASGHYRMPKPQYWDKPEIPYALDGSLENPKEVSRALKHIEEKTGVRFVAYETQADALVFQSGSEHCESTLGRLGGLQPIRLNKKCGWSEVVHEVLHALGFVHEQSRADRDRFVEVVWGNIPENYWPQFQKLNDDFLGPSKDTAFDYRSIMMYERDLFAKGPGLLTIKTKTSNGIDPSRAGLSAEDTRRVKKMFRLD